MPDSKHTSAHPAPWIRAFKHAPSRISARYPAFTVAAQVATVLISAAFFLFYGLIPSFGGAGLGLVGADEPRYAEVAREMLQRHDIVTPMLWGHVWLEKPALYYWRAMLSFIEFGVHDWAARLPSATFAFTLIVLIYMHMRSFRKGGEVDAALITVTCVAILSFARGASTDMQLAAPFCIGMLGWYAWYETGSKFWLFDLYFFNATATLAKGPVAPFLALLILVIFAALRKEWSVLRRTIWWPGVALYFAIVLPWYVEVQIRNPQFLKQFFLQQNLERFGSNLYHHEQPFWYYIPVAVLALMPWAVIALTAFADAVRTSLNEWRARRRKHHYVGHGRAGDAFPEFLVIWALVPIVFFSLSKSKLPGYILPSIPPLTILAADYINRIKSRRLKPWLLVLHAVTVGCMVTFVLLMPLHLLHPKQIPPGRALIAGGLTGIAAAVFILIMVAQYGVKRLRMATILPIAVLMFYIFGVGPVLGVGPMPNTKRNIHLIDMTFSARPMARILSQIAPPKEIVALYDVRREMAYGLSFYRRRQVWQYGNGHIPATQHILITQIKDIGNLKTVLKGRTYEELFEYPAQNLVVYEVAAKK